MWNPFTKLSLILIVLSPLPVLIIILSALSRGSEGDSTLTSAIETDSARG